MDLPINVVVKGKGSVTLDKNSYIAAGGQGTVCRLGDTAYKVYHDPKHMIPENKIEELKALSHLDNVLGPRDLLLDKNGIPIGFTMPYKPNTEFITRLFNKNYRADNNVTTEMIINLVKKAQLTLTEIHKCGILVVDYNELNSLTNIKYDDIYFIDVDSYGTKSFRASALMESVRDRQGKRGEFNEGTDWFSFAIVAFQLYMTYHPYMKGKHSVYKPKDWSVRMDNNVSIFHPEITLMDEWKDFSVIPKSHMDWFKQVFQDKVRSAPPLPDGVVMGGPVQPTLIIGNESFVITKIYDYPDKITGYFFFNGISYILTKKALFAGNRKIKDMNNFPQAISLGDIPGEDPVLAIKHESRVVFEDLAGNYIGEIAATKAVHYNGSIYSIHNSRMFESTFMYTGKKVLHTTKIVSNVFGPATKLYSGVAIQDILGKCWVSIPYQHGKCFSGPVKELNGQRVIDAKFDNHVLMAISEKDGKYTRHTICFDEMVSNYTYRFDANVHETSVSFTCLANGICVALIDDDTMEIFKTNDKIKEVKDPPITADMRLVNDATRVLFINNKGLYQLKLK